MKDALKQLCCQLVLVCSKIMNIVDLNNYLFISAYKCSSEDYPINIYKVILTLMKANLNGLCLDKIETNYTINIYFRVVIKIQYRKVNNILAIKPPGKLNRLTNLLCIVQSCRYIWHRPSHIVILLTYVSFIFKNCLERGNWQDIFIHDTNQNTRILLVNLTTTNHFKHTYI